jgi:hypothetical protein
MQGLQRGLTVRLQRCNGRLRRRCQVACQAQPWKYAPWYPGQSSGQCSTPPLSSPAAEDHRTVSQLALDPKLPIQIGRIYGCGVGPNGRVSCDCEWVQQLERQQVHEMRGVGP